MSDVTPIGEWKSIGHAHRITLGHDERCWVIEYVHQGDELDSYSIRMSKTRATVFDAQAEVERIKSGIRRTRLLPITPVPAKWRQR